METIKYYDLDWNGMGIEQLTCFTICDGTVASQTTDFPLPSNQLMAAGFLSVQKLPLRLIVSMLGYLPWTNSNAFSTP